MPSPRKAADTHAVDSNSLISLSWSQDHTKSSRSGVTAVISILLFLAVGAKSVADQVPIEVPLAARMTRHWALCGGEWSTHDGVLRQSDGWVAESSYEQSGHAFLLKPALGDFTVTFDFCVGEKSSGVGGAEFLFHSSDSQTYYILQFSTKANGVLLARADRQTFWTDLMRTSEVRMPRGEWHTVQVSMKGPEIRVAVNGKDALHARDDTLEAGLIGFGSSQAIVSYRNIRTTGEKADLKPPWIDSGGRYVRPNYKVICADAGAGGYEAFPDICRDRNGDLLCVFYAGYEHVSFPNVDLPRGARVCSVRSRDEGRTWGPPQIVADTEWDDRDPSVTCLRDGALICNWFTYYGGREEARPGNTTHYKELWLSFSGDNGHTWSEPWLVPSTANAFWGCSSPILELSDGDLIWPIYREYTDPLRTWSAVIRSSDKGKTWSDPVFVDENNDDNDEPALVELPGGKLLCVMRANHGDSMWWSVSTDKGFSWTPSEKIGFPGHAPYLHRSREGVLLLGHRLPHTSIHFSLDDGKTWSDNVLLDTCDGAYPSMVELKDGTVLFVYYEEGPGSSLRAQKLKVTRKGISAAAW